MSALFWSALALAGALQAAHADEPPALPEGFIASPLARGITGAVAMALSPDGRIFVCEQTGTLRVIRKDALLAEPFLTLKVDSLWERGLIGVALDPLFPEKPYVYVTYVVPDPYPHHRVSRFTARGDVAVPGSELVLLEGDDQTKLGGSVPAGHQGGPLRFGRDGKLYIAIGEQTAGAPSQDLGTFQGKILRINPDGSIPEDNPFVARTTGKYRAIWAMGLRNPFCLAFQPTTGRLFINDVGGSLFEEINEGIAGANYGWPQAEGPSDNPAFRNPVHHYGHGVGRCITGGAFYNPLRAQFPSPYEGKYFFMDFEDHWIKVLDPEHPKTPHPFATKLKRAVALEVAPDGTLVVLDRNAWVKDPAFRPSTGTVWRIRYDPKAAPAARSAPGNAPPPARAAFGISMNPDRLPERFSALGLFRSLPALEPAPGMVPYEVNVPQWADGARKRHWIGLPSPGSVGFAPRGEWSFPAGTVLVEHLERDRRLELRLLVTDGAGGGFGAAYRWKADGSDAELVDEGETWETKGAGTPRPWYSPGPLECLSCHSPPAGFVLGLSTRQMNRAPAAGGPNQILEWAARGMFRTAPRPEALEGLPRLVPISDASASSDVRARSYLDANCSGCHRPGGAGRGLFDARLETPLSEQHLVGSALISGDLGIREARSIVPGDLGRSILYERMKHRNDPQRMPPLGSLQKDEEALECLARWIGQLGSAQDR